MSIGIILFSLVIIGIVGLYVAKPLVKPNVVRRQRQSRYGRLQAEKDFLLDQISQLDFEYETGKLTELDYKEQRSQVMADAATVLMELDGMEARSEVGSETSEETTINIDLDIEAAVARMRLSSYGAEILGADDIDFQGQTSPDTKIESLFCTQCGRPAEIGDKFCSNCGQAIKQPQHA